jgi:uncharacterized protein (DUF1810 family)
MEADAMPQDPFQLVRFVAAQATTYAPALAELRAGHKRTHWMWFIFPQLRALGRSDTALQYGLASLDEAKAYLAHALLGPRLAACTDAVLLHSDRSVDQIFGVPDNMKFRSCMTVFMAAHGGDGGRFQVAIDRFCGGAPDDATLHLLGSEPPPPSQ